MNELLDVQVRVQLYREFIETTRAPTAQRLSDSLGVPVDEIRAALERLAAGKAIVLQPESRDVLMANPLSAVPTPYLVRCGSRAYFGACVWDGLGVIAMLKSDATLETSCACCGEAMSVAGEDGRPGTEA